MPPIAVGTRSRQAPRRPDGAGHTFSIVARADDGARIGVAACGSLPAVGAFCPAARPGVGAVCVQGVVQPLWRRRVLELLAEGVGAEEAVERVLATDPGRDVRQLAAVGRKGPAAAWTGEGVAGFAGQRTGDGYAVIGTHLAAEAALDAMAQAFVDSPAHDLPERLMRALEAAVAAGGDRRGDVSASLLVVDRDGYRYVDLRVDEHRAPVAELRRLVDLQAERFLPGYVAWVQALEEQRSG
jgi:uncharacterized Ntn-hydrolase superfamily protein